MRLISILLMKGKNKLSELRKQIFSYKVSGYLTKKNQKPKNKEYVFILKIIYLIFFFVFFWLAIINNVGIYGIHYDK